MATRDLGNSNTISNSALNLVRPAQMIERAMTLRRGRINLLLALAISTTVPAVAQPVPAVPAAGAPVGMVGWWYFKGFWESGFALTPEEACGLTAINHLGTPLEDMTPVPFPAAIFDCHYRHFLGTKRLFSYGQTKLFCQDGYKAKLPGVCVKNSEPALAADPRPSKAGFTCSNPVVVSTGSKVQTENDMPGAPNGALRIDRTYRSIRDFGGGQSGGRGWSFSFDRQLSIFVPLPNGEQPNKIDGAFGDGSFFEVHRSSAEVWTAPKDNSVTLKSLNNAFDEWLLTNRDGSVERFKKINKEFLLVSTNTREGLGQFYEYSPDNKLTSITDSTGRTLSVTWIGHVVASIAGATGSAHYRYAPTSRQGGLPLRGTEQLVAVEYRDESGHLLSTKHYHYDDPNYRHLLTGITDENGARFATYEYNASGEAIVSEHAGGANRHGFDYSQEKKRVITDPLGTRRELDLTFVPDKKGRVTRINQPAGVGSAAGESTFTYDDTGGLSSTVDFNGIKTCFITDKTRGTITSEVAGLAGSAKCPGTDTATIPTDARRTSTRWHPHAELAVAIASPKQITTRLYNGQRDANGSIASCAENATLPSGKPIIVLCAKTVQTTSDVNGGQGFAARPQGRARIWRYSYNAAGQLLTQTGPKNANGVAESTTHTYYEDTALTHTKGDLASTANAAGELTQILELTRDGLPTKIKRPNGVVVSVTYDARQHITATTQDSGSGGSETTQYAYDKVGQLTGIVAPDGSSMTLGYDDAHRVTSLTDGAGNRMQLTLDNVGNVTRQEVRNATAQLVSAEHRSFDALSRLASAQREAQASSETYQYDRKGNLTTIKDPVGRVTTQAFDNLDRMAKITLPSAAPGQPAGTITLGNDHQDQVVSVSDPRNLTTRYTHDGHGDRTKVASPDTGESSYAFDDAGNLVSSRDARGFTTTYSYDAARRVTKAGNSSYEYGKSGTSGSGQLTAMADESGKSSFNYDGHGRLSMKTQIVGSGTSAKQFSVVYGYGNSGSSKGHVTSMTYPSGNRIDITYGTDGRASSLLLVPARAGKPTTVLSNLGYMPFGSVKSWNWGDATPSPQNAYERQFDAAGRLTSYPLGQPNQNGSVRTVAYDDANRITSIKHTGGANAAIRDQRYAYDDLDRLTGVDSTSVSQNYTYDLNGNRTGARFGNATYANTISAASNQLLKTSGPSPAKTNLYDKAGNLTSDGTVKYSYSASGRLATVTVAGISTGYRYNGFGQRVMKSGAKGNTGYYVYDPAGQLLGEYDEMGKPIQETIYLDNSPVGVIRPSGVNGTTELFYIYADHIQTARLITRASDGRVVWRWDNVDPFGLQQPDEAPGGLPKFTYNPRFPGQVFDKETNNHYNYFRDYDPQTGRYVQSDPIGLAGGVNTYGYVNGNPLSSTDPLGLFSYTAHLGITSVAVQNDPAFSGLPRMVADADFVDGSQDVGNSFMHAMRDGVSNQSVAEARQLFDKFIDDQISKCTLQGLARAAHAAQDFYAPGHENFQAWSGGHTWLHIPAPKHIFGDFFTFGKRRREARKHTQVLIKRYKKKCQCLQNNV